MSSSDSSFGSSFFLVSAAGAAPPAAGAAAAAAGAGPDPAPEETEVMRFWKLIFNYIKQAECLNVNQLPWRQLLPKPWRKVLASMAQPRHWRPWEEWRSFHRWWRPHRLGGSKQRKRKPVLGSKPFFQSQVANSLSSERTNAWKTLKVEIRNKLYCKKI